MKSRLTIALALGLVGCTQMGSDLPLQSPTALQRDTPTSLEATYKLGAGDQISLTIYGEQELSKSYTIGPSGMIEVPLIGQIKAVGVTIDDLSRTVAAQLAQGFLKNPSVSGAIITYRPFYILGEVNKPGQYPYQSGMSLASAVATAGGYTYRAQKDFVFIRTENTDGEKKVQALPDLSVRPGDTIRVAERFF